MSATEHSPVTGAGSALWTALAAARAEVQPVERDGQSTGSQAYSYASAQAILAVATPLLARHGLVLVPTELERVDEQALMMHRHFLLVHTSGQAHPFPVDLPIVITTFRTGNSTARDKAVLAARTAALRSAYRDVLGLPAVERSEEPEARVDEPQRPERPQRRPAPQRQDRPRDEGPPPDDTPPPEAPRTEMPRAEPPADPRRVKTLGQLRTAAKTLGLEAFAGVAGRPASSLANASTVELLKVLQLVEPVVERHRAAEAEARARAQEAEEEARAAKALQDAAEQGETTAPLPSAPSAPTRVGPLADDFEARARAAAARAAAERARAAEEQQR